MSTNRRDFTQQIFAPSFSGDGAAVTNLTRANVAAASPSFVVINQAVTGRLGEEEHLQPVRGGIGGAVSWESKAGNDGPNGVLVGIAQGATGVFTAFNASATATANSVLVRDADGDAYVGNPVINNNITLNPSAGTTATIHACSAQTNGAVTSTILSMNVSDGLNANSMVFSGDITLVTETTGANRGSVSFEFRAYHAAGGAITITTPFTNLVYSMPAVWSGIAALTADSIAAGIIRLRVTGVAGHVINWGGLINVIQRRV